VLFLVTLAILHKNIFQLHKITYIPIVVQLQNTNYFCEGKNKIITKHMTCI